MSQVLPDVPQYLLRLRCSRPGKDGETPLFDGLGSERTVTDSSQGVTASLTLSAFGQTVASSGSSTSAYQYGATSGYRSDGDAGLTLVGCRFYDAQVGRFITRDTYLDQAPYAYCDGDPVNAVDPSGHKEGEIEGIFAWLFEPFDPRDTNPDHAVGSSSLLLGETLIGIGPVWNRTLGKAGDAPTGEKDIGLLNTVGLMYMVLGNLQKYGVDNYPGDIPCEGDGAGG